MYSSKYLSAATPMTVPVPPPVRRARARFKRTVGTVLAQVAPGLSPRAAAAQIAVVVNSTNPVDELSIDKLRRLFLGQAATFPTGKHARLAMHAPSVTAFDRSALDLAPDIVRSLELRSIDRVSVQRATELAAQLAVAF